MKRIVSAMVALSLLALFISSCNGEDPAPETVEPAPEPTSTAAGTESGEIVTGLAQVESVEAIVPDTPNPQTVTVVVDGTLADGCTSLAGSNIQRSNDAFFINLSTERVPDEVCDQALQPFEETLALDVAELPAGTYRVDVNGVGAEFTLTGEPTPTPEPTVEPTPEPVTGTGVISGRVVHDICAIAGGEGGAPAEPGEGCVEAEDGGFIADGVLTDAEPGLGGIEVQLGQGACPSTGLATTVTDETGAYAFEELAAGAYCVSVPVLDSDNAELLIPGTWTAPVLSSAGVISNTITLFEDQTVDDANFGWDYQFLPEPEQAVNPPDCSNVVAFVRDVTIPDDTTVGPGEAFVKTWLLANNGSCTWTTDYSLIFADGELMTNDTDFPLPFAVAPGDFVELSVTMIAPLDEGTYRASFLLADEEGNEFGVPPDEENEDNTFWAQIVVEEGAAQPEPNSAVITGTVWIDDDGDAFYDSFEEPLEGVEIQISAGVCPQDGIVDDEDIITTTFSAADGTYIFEELSGGSYCVSIAAFSEANVNLLIPGDWTYPAQGVGLVTVILVEGQELGFVDFGWQYR